MLPDPFLVFLSLNDAAFDTIVIQVERRKLAMITYASVIVLALTISSANLALQSDEVAPRIWSKSAEKLASEGKPAEALALYLRCFDEGGAYAEYKGVRVSFLLEDIMALGASYPPAIEALRERREAARIQVATAGDKGTKCQAISDLVALNDALGDRTENLAIYDNLRANNEDEHLLRILESRVAEELAARGEGPRKSTQAQAIVEHPDFVKPIWEPVQDADADLDDRWSMIKLRIARLSVEHDNEFHRSLSTWLNPQTGMAWVVRGDATQDVEGKSVVHVFGNVSHTIKVSGQSEIVIGGDLLPLGRIEADGITRVFIGGSLAGEIRSLQSLSVTIEGDLVGVIRTGTPKTDIRVEGNFEGSIEPVSVGSLIYLTVLGDMAAEKIKEVAVHNWTQFKASIGRSDLPAGMYPKYPAARSVSWVVHNTRP